MSLEKRCPGCARKLQRKSAQYAWHGVIMHGWVCPSCNSLWDIGGAFIRYVTKVAKKENKKRDPDTDPDWTGSCENCGESPIVPATGMCGPCTFGEADTAGGNW